MLVKKYFRKYKKEFKEALNDLKSIKTVYKQIPNILTFMRLVLSLPMGILYFINPVISIIGISFLWATDAVDGKIARKLKIQSKLGADMDAVADKFMFLASAIPLLSISPFLGVNFLLEGTIAAVNVMGRMKNINTKTVLSGKIKTVFMAITLVLGYLVRFFGISSIGFHCLVGLTTWLQLFALKDYINEYDRMSCEMDDKVFNANVSDVENVENKEKILSKNNNINRLNELKELKTFVLSSQVPGKKYSGKKRIRKMIQEKKNI